MCLLVSLEYHSEDCLLNHQSHFSFNACQPIDVFFSLQEVRKVKEDTTMHIQDEHPCFVWMHLPYEMSTTSRIHSASLFLLLVPRRHPALQIDDDDDVGRRSEDDNEPKEHRGV
ncbi:hypothetical protein B9Z55_009963 [Caenorhabditis nigoni]|uniref:Uncharacterized protein n=1 Tax=Caenorhabditis nigoni TaxID=1611254 RepID=A0A2G5UU65_9PELO|nr:hypothetical protein B9Z55_009963 [Caenorhabditis nigoni]